MVPKKHFFIINFEGKCFLVTSRQCFIIINRRRLTLARRVTQCTVVNDWNLLQTSGWTWHWRKISSRFSGNPEAFGTESEQWVIWTLSIHLAVCKGIKNWPSYLMTLHGYRAAEKYPDMLQTREVSFRRRSSLVYKRSPLFE